MPKNHKSNCQCCICREEYHHSEQTKQKISKSLAGKTPWNKGLTKETDSRVAKSAKNLEGNHPSEEKKRNQSKRMKGNKNPFYGKHHTKETIKKNREAHLGICHSEESNKKRSKTHKQLWRNPKFKESRLKANFKSLKLKPNKPEILLNSILQDMFPNQYKYVGDGSILIGYKNPDFISIKGKKIIELFGDYWHSEKYRLLTFNDCLSNKKHEQQRINHFTKYGYQTLIVWEHELKDIDLLKQKLQKFNNKRK